VQASDKWCWSVADVADYLGRPVAWVYDNYRRLGIPAIKVGQALRFRPRDVERWAEAQAVSAA
jgi:excisionase family DNA binding protein